MHIVPYIDADAPLDPNVLIAATTMEVNGTVLEEAECSAIPLAEMVANGVTDACCACLLLMIGPLAARAEPDRGMDTHWVC